MKRVGGRGARAFAHPYVGAHLDVGFLAKSGHSESMCQCPLMTQSRHYRDCADCSQLGGLAHADYTNCSNGVVSSFVACKGRASPTGVDGTSAPLVSSGGCGLGHHLSQTAGVSTSKIKPRTGTSFEIQGCDLTISIWSLVCCSGSSLEQLFGSKNEAIIAPWCPTASGA